LPGVLRVKRNAQGIPTIYSRSPDDNTYDKDDLLRPVYDNKPLGNQIWDDFDTMKARVQEQWAKVPPKFNPISAELQIKIDNWIKAQDKLLLEAV